MEAYFHSLIRGDKRGIWPALQRAGLWAASVPYGWTTRVRNWLFDRGWKKSYSAQVPVVSVGNLTLGGTGKTPCVEFIARFFRNLDKRVVLLSRGYGADHGRNDEALALEINLPDVPHLQGLDRALLARIAVEELEAEVLVLDDGFQHRRLRRDLDLVLIDATAPWGHGHLFPRGLLREAATGLRRAHAAVLTRCDQVGPEILKGLRDAIAGIAPNVPVVETTHEAAAWINHDRDTLPLEFLRTRPLAGFCGIGNPEAFRRTLQSLGACIVDWRTFGDHHRYTRADIEDLRNWARSLPPDAALVTTQKDLVKVQLNRLGDRELWALKIQLQVQSGKEVLEEKLTQLVGCSSSVVS